MNGETCEYWKEIQKTLSIDYMEITRNIVGK